MRKAKIGVMDFHGSVDITDPCYDKDVWCRMNNVKISEGELPAMSGVIPTKASMRTVRRIRIYWLVRLGYTETVIYRARRTWRKSAA